MDRASFLTGLAALFAPETGRFAEPQSVTVPMLLQNNRIFVDADYTGPAGRSSTLQTQIDTGGGALVLARRFAEDLGLLLHAKADKDGFVQIAPPGLYIGSDPVPVPLAASTAAPSSVVGPGGTSPAFLPGAYFRGYAVTFDYTGGALGLNAQPLRSTQIPVRIAAKSGFPRIELTIDGETMGFLFDTGASFSMLSQRVVDRLRANNASWRTARGAYGPANMTGGFGERDATMLRIPQARLGPMLLEDIDVVSRPEGTFEQYMSSMMSAPVAGALGGNVLRNFSFRLDYPQQRLEMRFTRRPWPSELTIAPIILQPQRDGSYSITLAFGHADLNGAHLVAVDGHEVGGLSLYAVQQLLRGTPGSSRSLSVVDAEKRTREVNVAVVTIL